MHQILDFELAGAWLVLHNAQVSQHGLLTVFVETPRAEALGKCYVRGMQVAMD
jgi:hypothetical protein